MPARQPFSEKSERQIVSEAANSAQSRATNTTRATFLYVCRFEQLQGLRNCFTAKAVANIFLHSLPTLSRVLLTSGVSQSSCNLASVSGFKKVGEEFENNENLD